MTILFSNNAVSTLAGSISNVAVVATLASGTGALFPNPGVGQYFIMTFVDAETGLENEIVKCTTRSGDIVTIVRGQEGTSARNWLAGDIASELLTAGGLSVFVQETDLQKQAGNYAQDVGTSNQIVITLDPAPATLTDLIGVPVRVKRVNSTNTGDVTVVVNGLTPISLVNPAALQLVSNELPANGIIEFIFDGTNAQLTTSFPFPLETGVVGTLPLANSNFNLLSVISTPGSGNFTVPATKHAIFVEVQGDGGGGAGANSSTTLPGGGAGAGGYCYAWLTVSPGDVIPYVVGAGGVAGVAGTTGTDGADGGGSSFGSGPILLGAGGKGGNSTSDASGGAGGTVTLTVPGGGANGGDGTDGNPTDINAGAGSGGASFFGGGSRGSTIGTVDTGAPGSGGGGGYVAGPGSNGAPGVIRVWG